MSSSRKVKIMSYVDEDKVGPGQEIVPELEVSEYEEDEIEEPFQNEELEDEGDEEAEVEVDQVAPSVPDDLGLEDVDPETELWPGGPTAGMILDWKDQFGDVYVTSLSNEDHYVWRVLSRKEYKLHIKTMESMGERGELSAAESSLYNEEAITAMCMLYPMYSAREQEFGPAGLPSLIAQEIMEASGFVALAVRQL